jgi:hypothetical protein
MERGDHRPGRSPRIETEGGVTRFTFRINVYDERVIELVVRREDTGELFAALRSAKKNDATA